MPASDALDRDEHELRLRGVCPERAAHLRRDERLGREILNGNDEGKKDLFNSKPSELATPDIVLAAGNSTTLVIEVKNVPVKQFFSDRSAMAQTSVSGSSPRPPPVDQSQQSSQNHPPGDRAK